MSRFNVSIRGVDAVVRNLEVISERVKTEVKNSIRDSCLDLRGKAQELAPIDSGDLRGSASNDVRERNKSIKGEVGFNTSYALEQHENLTYRHTDGQAKYLEKPLKENAEQYANDIKDAVRRGTT